MIKQSENADITSLTTFGITAGCGSLFEYDTDNDLAALHSQGVFRRPYITLGGGSNLLFVNGFYPGAVITSRNDNVTWRGLDTDFPLMECGAALQLDRACSLAAEVGLWGLENLSGIPGSIGGAAVQNAGAYGAEFADAAVTLKVFDTRTGQTAEMPAANCGYGYRTSIFKAPENSGRYIITAVTFRLSRPCRANLSYRGLTEALGYDEITAEAASALTPRQIRTAVLAVRDRKLPDPSKAGSAGSFFKNPVVSADEYQQIICLSGMEPSGHRQPDGSIKLSAAWLIDKAGCRTLTCGGAALWPSQPLVLVNASGATGADVATLAAEVSARVRQRFGVTLTPEVIYIR